MIERGWHRDVLAGICFDRADLRPYHVQRPPRRLLVYVCGACADELMFANLRSARLGSSDLRSANLSFSDLESGVRPRRSGEC